MPGDRTVWIARPEPAASRTAGRIAALGFEPVVAPVLAVRPTRAPLPEGTFAGLVLTSANAVEALAASGVVARLRDLPTFAVGARTAALAERAGFGRVEQAGGDAAALSALIREHLSPGSALLYPAGADRKAEPGASLAAAGYAVTAFTVYAAEPVEHLPPSIAERLARAGGLGAVLHYSRRSAEIALALAEAAGLGWGFRDIRHLCLSRDVAVPLEQGGVPIHFVPARPNEDDLLAGLAKRF